MLNQLTSRGLSTVLFLLLAACSADVDTLDTLQPYVGLECSIEGDGADHELNLQESEACGEAICMKEGREESQCTCRCSGPQDGIPKCACPEAFHCQDDMVEDLGGEGDIYAGGYCVPD